MYIVSYIVSYKLKICTNGMTLFTVIYVESCV